MPVDTRLLRSDVETTCHAIVFRLHMNEGSKIMCLPFTPKRTLPISMMEIIACLQQYGRKMVAPKEASPITPSEHVSAQIKSQLSLLFSQARTTSSPI